jgi:uncharacterized damage-inducible protein DinB
VSEEGFGPDFAATFRNLMLDVIGREAEVTARVLAAVPDDSAGYRPAPDSRSAAEVAWHIAADVWFLDGIARREFEVNPDQTHPNPTQSMAELGDWYVARVREALERLRAVPAEQLAAPLTLGGVAEQSGTAFPAFVYLLWAHTHTVHHRGQLAAYLRPMGAKVPGIYGPSRDEPA